VLLLLLPCSFLSLGPPGLLFFRKLGTGIFPPPLEELDSVVEASDEVSDEHCGCEDVCCCCKADSESDLIEVVEEIAAAAAWRALGAILTR